MADDETLREAILARLRRGEAAALLVREAELLAERGRAGRELAEVQQRIPLWQRLLFFVDSGDEQREDALQARLTEAEEGLQDVRARLEVELEQVGKEYPAFGLAVQLERLAGSAREGLRTQTLLKLGSRRGLQEELARAAVWLREAWAPDLDEEALVAALADERRCQDAAEGQGAPTRHPRTGWVPLGPRQLQAVLARALLQGDFFPARREAQQLEARRAALEAEHGAAREAVPLLDRVNVLSTSAQEAHRDGLGKELTQVEQLLRGARGRERAALHLAWAAHPPLLVHQRLVELQGLLAAVEPGSEVQLTMAGKVVPTRVITPRALLAAGLREVEAAFRQAFPGVPWPREAARELAGGALPAAPDPQAWLAPAFAALDAGEAPRLRAEALQHAGLAAHLRQGRQAAASRVSWIDWLVFWSDTPDEARARELGLLAAWHHRVARGQWERLLELAVTAGQTVVPIRVRDLAIELCAAVSEIRTDSGSSSSPRSCAVYGREAALGLTRRIADELGRAYGLVGTREAMMDVVAATDPPDGPEPPAGPFAPLPRQAVVELLARRLAGSDFRREHAAVRELLRSRKATAFEQAQAADQISWWDRINVFSTTEAEQREREKGSQLAQLDADLRRRMQALDRLFERALAAYPPARPFFALGGVQDALHSITAVCRSRTVSSGSGKNRRTRRVYYCDLNGKAAARSALEGWCQLLVATFGRLPGQHELLVLWEQSRREIQI